VSVLGADPAPTPSSTPSPPPSAGGIVVTFDPDLTAEELERAIADMDVDVIELTSGTYRLGAVEINVDRTSRPLTIRPTGGASVTFKGSGEATAGGQFYFGLSSPAKWITFSGPFTFDGYLLAQAGIFELRQSDHVTLRDITIRNISRDAVRADKAYFTWGAYISGNNRHLTASGWNLIGSGREWSGIQIDSGTSASSVKLLDMTMSDLDYAFYENVPTTDLLLDGWVVSNCSSSNGTAISFHQATGVYRNMTGTSSGRISVNQSGMVAEGGIDWP
jgi:hypothetical protein